MAKEYTEKEVQEIAKSLIGKTFGELNKYNLDPIFYDKGSFGHIIETDVYEYDINSESRPDFEEAGIELKVTPYKINKNRTLSAKERLVLNIINYLDEWNCTFYTSSFWLKNKKIQIVWYLADDNKRKDNFTITNEVLFEFPEEDLEIIKDDWNQIVQRIKDGKAHELSEGDTMYLGACTKGANARSLRKQPFSDIPAKQRAYCLKTTYMTQLVRKYIGGADDVEKLVKDKRYGFKEYVDSVVNKYIGKTKEELIKELNIDSNPNAKNIFNIIVNRMFNVKSALKKTDEFLKANIEPKTIRIEKNGSIEQSMSFPYFSFTEIALNDFEDSEIRELFETKKFMFFVFKNNGENYIFEGYKLWNMPMSDIETEVRKVYDRTREIIRNGDIVEYVDEKGKRHTNFPHTSFSSVCHVRPHGKNDDDTLMLYVKDKVTGANSYMKHGFWLNSSYMKSIVKEFID